MEMFDETKVVKPWFNEEQVYTEREMAEAIADLQHCWKQFKEADAQPNAPLSLKHMKNWWRCVDSLGLAESRAKQVFTGGDMSPASIQQYNKWRLHWLTGIGGEYYKADA